MLMKTLIFLLIIILAVDCQSTCNDANAVNDVIFKNLGYFIGFTNDGNSEYRKTYFSPRYLEESWGNARTICKSFGMELATLETYDEAVNLLHLVKNHNEYDHFNSWIYIDGVVATPQSKTEWYWSKNGQKLSVDLPWYINNPDNSDGVERCLSIGKYNQRDDFGYNDIICSQRNLPFICQRIDWWMSYD